MSPQTLFFWMKDFLTRRGWRRDGDDPGIWVKPGSGSYTIGDAVEVELTASGIDLG